jgi:hypothetical protein
MTQQKGTSGNALKDKERVQNKVSDKELIDSRLLITSLTELEGSCLRVQGADRAVPAAG